MKYLENRKLHRINEFLANDMIYLKNYFNMSDEDRASTLPEQYSHELENFLDSIQEEDERTGVNVDELLIQLEEEGEDMDYYKVEWLMNNKPKIYKEFGEWLFDKISKYQMDSIVDSEYPAWYFFSSPTLIKNQWLVHFTDDASSIARDGFTIGAEDINKLGLTTHLGEYDKKYGGYNFAYTPTDADRYGYEGNGNYKYGNEAVIFRASGIRLWHSGDEEYQVIFFGKTARKIIPLTQGEENRWGVHNNKTGNQIYSEDGIDVIISWVIKNYTQYHKIL